MHRSRQGDPAIDDLTELVIRMAARDHDALAELYDACGTAAWSLARRIVVDSHLAEEAVHDAFLAAWNGAASFDPTVASARSWLLTLVRRRAIDRVRREQRHRRGGVVPVDDEALQIQDASSEADPFAGAWAAARSATVRDAMDELSPDHRSVLELAYFTGLSQSELADRLGVPVGTIKTRTFRALSRLRDLLDARGVNGGEAR